MAHKKTTLTQAFETTAMSFATRQHKTLTVANENTQHKTQGDIKILGTRKQ